MNPGESINLPKGYQVEFVGATWTQDLFERIIHQCWVSYQIAAGQPYNEEPTEAQLASIRDGLRHAVDFPESTSEQSHENWMRFRLATGWKLGPVKDEEKKEHPDLIPYAELPEVERRKDEQFQSAVQFCWRLYMRMYPAYTITTSRPD